jgi:peptide/nickel transport system substrate-binding protein
MRAGSPQYQQLAMNAAGPYLADQSVRQAVAEALDRQAIAQSDLVGLEVPETVLDSHFFMPEQLGYADDAGKVGVYNPAAARQLLTQAGWTQAAGGPYRTKDGKELDLSLLIPQGAKVAADEASQITSMLEQVGIKVTVTQEDDEDLLPALAAGGFDLTVLAQTLDEFPVSGNVAQYQSDTGQDGTWGANYSHLASRSLDSLLAKATSAATLADETTTINQADQRVWQEAGSIPLYQEPEIDVQVRSLANYGAFGYADVVWQNVGFLLSGSPTP